MSRRWNCYDNAVAENFFQLLNRKRIKRKIYSTRDLARQDIFDYIEMLYNPIRRQTMDGNIFLRLRTVYGTLADSLSLAIRNKTPTSSPIYEPCAMIGSLKTCLAV